MVFSVFRYDVVKKENAADALEFLQTEREKVSAIITDLKMPGINGINFFRVVDEKKLLIHPFILISGFYHDRDSNLRYLGVDKVFQKPVEFTKLIAYLQEFIATGYAI